MSRSVLLLFRSFCCSVCLFEFDLVFFLVQPETESGIQRRSLHSLQRWARFGYSLCFAVPGFLMILIWFGLESRVLEGIQVYY